jgi:hypothetical protein
VLALSALTWRQEGPDSYLPVKPWLQRLSRFDAKIPVPQVGYWLHIEARRK